MGETALLVTLGTAISESVNARVHVLAEALHSRGYPGLTELVPAYASLLVIYDPEVLAEEDVRVLIRQALAVEPRATSYVPRTVEILVVYGGEYGPDLEDVARLHGVSPGEVISRHTAGLYRVYFLGFMPGFGYMGGLDPALATPRLPTPRVRAPAGSVGIAGAQTGVYPFASPGGWRLIGRTPVKMWDVTREESALLAPGDHVRFTECGEFASEEDALNSVPPFSSSGVPAFEALQPGASTTVQDFGRRGYAQVGLSGGGAMDPLAAGRANLLLGNEPGAAVLELTWSGPQLRALSTTAIALAGADMQCRVDGVAIPLGVSWLVRADSVVTFGGKSGRSGARAYLGVAGGFDVPLVLGSRSTYLPARFGGYSGRALRAGDVLRAVRTGRTASEVAGRVDKAPKDKAVRHGDIATLRVVRYDGEGSAGHEAFARLLETGLTALNEADRMGVRLKPDSDLLAEGESMGELLSFGVVRGAVQLPSDGRPLVLAADHQTTGGYPVLGVVARADWPVLAALVPGQRVRFEEIAVEEARQEYRLCEEYRKIYL